VALYQESAAVSQIEVKSSGTVRFTSTMRYVTNARNEQVVISRNGEFIIEDDAGSERESHKVPYGATLSVNDG
jgi:DNA-directed RNA polymerase subunit beta'